MLYPPLGDVALDSRTPQQETVSNQARERKRKRAEEVFQRVYRDGPLASRDKLIPTIAQQPRHATMAYEVHKYAEG
jgi:hypothetical protein